MVRLASILLTSLLLYHTFRASMVLYFLDDTHITASKAVEEDEWVVVKMPVSLPYATDWEDTGGKEGLIQHGDHFYNIVEQRYQNDTLYTTLKTNISAREQFFSLVEEINDLSGKSAQSDTKNPYSSLVKLLKQLSTVYVSPYFARQLLYPTTDITEEQAAYYTFPSVSLAFPVLTPPPQLSQTV